MTEKKLKELYENLPPEDPGRLVYTRKAFRMIPRMKKPRILDIGCGEGGVSLELARLSNGRVTGVDIDQSSLDRFKERIDKAGLSDTVTAVNSSMKKLNFPDKSYDIIWSEGSIQFIGFDRGLKEWYRLIRPGGFLVVHLSVELKSDIPKEIVDAYSGLFPGVGTIQDYQKRNSVSKYEIINCFLLPEDAWWDLYYGPIEKRILNLRSKYCNDSAALAVLDKEQDTVNKYKKYQEWYGSAFIILRKKD